MRIKHSTGAAASLVHDGRTFEPEEDGFFRVPFDLAQTLIRLEHWEAEPATVVVPEAPEPEEELTPAQKGALTKAANAKAAAEAEAK